MQEFLRIILAAIFLVAGRPLKVAGWIVAILLFCSISRAEAPLVPPDDRADVALLIKRYGDLVKVDDAGNVWYFQAEDEDRLVSPALRSALARLHNVRTVMISGDAEFYLHKVFTNWTELEGIAFTRNVTDNLLSELERYHKLNYIEAIGNQSDLTDLGVKSLAKHKGLVGLSIEYSKITDSAMKDIAGLPNLTNLNLYRNYITDEGIKLLKGKKLVSLNLRSTRVTDQGMDALKDMTSLKELDVVDTKVTSVGRGKLKGIPNLQIEWYESGKPVGPPDDPADVAAIEAAGVRLDKNNVTDNIERIYRLDVNSEAKSRAWMKYLKGLHSVTEINMAHEMLADEDLKNLAGLKSLESMCICCRPPCDEGMKVIGTLTNLKQLYIFGPGITDSSAKCFASLVNLEKLCLAETSVGDDALRYLSGMKKLKELRLDKTKITDAGLANLVGLSSIDKLYITQTAVTGKGLKNLSSLKSLRVVYCTASDRYEGLLELKKYIPNLLILDEAPVNSPPKSALRLGP